MKKRGFTLVELMGVVIILGIIILIATPTIRKMTSNSKDELYNIQINNIMDGLKNWSIDNSQNLPQNEGEVITITLGQLKMGGYVESEIKNPKTNKCFGNDMTLTVTRYQKNYTYEVNESTGIETASCDDYRKPHIILKGDSIKYVEINDLYVDEGVIAKDAIGNNITSNVTTTITGSGTEIDTSIIGNKYTVTYTVTSGGETASINRIVIIRDTTAPIITIPENVVLNKSETSFDVMEGVSATDNSGETIEILTKSNISFGIPGEYTITYTAKDSSGNTTIKTRLVKINKEYKLSDLAITDSDLEVSSVAACSKSGVCEEGTAFAIKVNEEDKYKFYVIKDTGSKVTLIMDRNLGDTVAWFGSDECVTVEEDTDGDGNNDYSYESCGDTSTSSYGPITALKALQSRTNTWTNLQQMIVSTFEYEDETQGTLVDNMGFTTYARMPKYSELKNFGTVVEEYGYSRVSDLPIWLYDNIDTNNIYGESGYWLATTIASSARYVSYNGEIPQNDSGGYSVGYNDIFGIRPVIELFK